MKKLLLLVWCALLSGCACMTAGDFEDIPLKPVAHVDLDRYMGRWYMMANIPYFAERGNLAPHVDYRKRPDGLIEDRLTARKGSFNQAPSTKVMEIEIYDATNNAEGRITYRPFPGQDFSILYLDPQYRYTVIGHPSRKYAWLFAREPQLPQEIYEAMLKTLRQNQYDTRQVLLIPHLPEQLGAPGYQ